MEELRYSGHIDELSDIVRGIMYWLSNNGNHLTNEGNRATNDMIAYYFKDDIVYWICCLVATTPNNTSCERCFMRASVPSVSVKIASRRPQQTESSTHNKLISLRIGISSYKLVSLITFVEPQCLCRLFRLHDAAKVWNTVVTYRHAVISLNQHISTLIITSSTGYYI